MITANKVERLTKRLRAAGWPGAGGVQLPRRAAELYDLAHSVDSLIQVAAAVRAAADVEMGATSIRRAAEFEKRVRKALGFTYP